MNALPLAGRRILVTRAAHQASKLGDALRALGAEPVEVPVLEIGPPENLAPLDAALRKLATYDWLIFTSANAVRAVADRPKEQGAALQLPKSTRIAAIGAATANAVEQIGLKVDLIPDSYVAESLVRDLLQNWQEVSGHDFSRAKSESLKSGALAPEGSLRGLRFLLARAAVARDVIPDALRAAGAQVDVVDAYRNVLPEEAPQKLLAALAGPINAATFTSSSSVTHMAEAAKKAGVAFPFPGVSAISIGPVTSQTLRESGWEPAAEAIVSDIAGLVAAVERLLRR
ncbi:MAG: uroporphyrinogen-III synthase [Terracidiphilus sp.]